MLKILIFCLDLSIYPIFNYVFIIQTKINILYFFIFNFSGPDYPHGLHGEHPQAHPGVGPHGHQGGHRGRLFFSVLL